MLMGFAKIAIIDGTYAFDPCSDGVHRKIIRVLVNTGNKLYNVYYFNSDFWK